MPQPNHQTNQLIRQAKAGSKAALGQLLDRCRRYLLRIAGEGLDPRLRAKGGASDLVQETFLEAQQDFGEFAGDSERELRAWLRHRLRYRLGKFVRSYRQTAKRAAGREVPLDDCGSSSAPGAIPAANQLSPSDCALAGERDLLLEQAMGRLPEEYRRVIDLRYRQGLSFEQIGDELARTPNSARKLWARAIERLKRDFRAQASK
jgi:RNA polymerase sigma-70 factor (ECF subfamily)